MDAKIMAKILLAEDEQNIASFIRRGLQEFGHEVQVEHDGGTAWSMLQEGVFDLLVLDVIMPKMDGLEVCRQFRLKEGYHTPVIMLTALGTTEDIVKGAGCRGGRLSGETVQFPRTGSTYQRLC